ncbi:serine hydrolase domain-containing protein [Photobacterium sanguinicancri]|uniref:serine hydrolase domain-containing protein n=1 Tax=Photobacterium sanguinicancri TaxID=875932 RepID=UPI0021C2C2B2|nr:serine hydrolase domain-containing protein [Photobacterium sanguinicancri]
MWVCVVRGGIKRCAFIISLIVAVLFTSSFAVAERAFDKAKMDQYLHSLADNNKATLSVVFTEKGQVTYSKQTVLPKGAITAFKGNQQYKVGSITKTFTSVLVFQQIEQGKLTLSTPLSDFYPNIKNAEKITIGQLLSHRSGIFNYTNAPEFNAYFAKYQDKKELLARIASYKPVFEPDASYEYSNSNYALLGYILEDVTGKSYTDLVQNNIISPLDLKETKYCAEEADCGKALKSFYFYQGHWNLMPQWSMSVANSAGAVLSTPYDLTRFIRALFHGELISHQSLAMMKGIKNTTSKGLFKLPFYTKSSYGHRGKIESFLSDVSYFDADDVALSVTVDALNHNFNDILVAVLSIYFDRPFELPDFDRKPISLAIAQLKKYEGTFTTPSVDVEIKVFLQDGMLMMQAAGQAPLPAEPYSLYEFEYKPAGILCKFAKTKDGAVDYTQFTLHQVDWILPYSKQ